jgi:hypothetical protein
MTYWGWQLADLADLQVLTQHLYRLYCLLTQPLYRHVTHQQQVGR